MITITSSSATIQWMLTEPYNASRPETFTVYYGMSSGQLNLSTPEITASTASQTYSTQLNSLQPATVYFYTIQSENKFVAITTDVMSFITNEVEESKLYTCCTDDCIIQPAFSHCMHCTVSSEVTNLQAVSTNDDTLVISWEPPATPNGRILRYSVSIINLKDGTTVRQENTISTTITQTNLGKIHFNRYSSPDCFLVGIQKLEFPIM